MKRIFIIALAILAFAVAAGIEGSAQQEDRPLVEDGITYAVANGIELKLDLARPATGKGPFPVLIYLAGNGWGWYGGINRTQHSVEIQSAARHGYVAASVDYREAHRGGTGATQNVFPAQVHDVKAAVRWLRANAAKYDIDPSRIGAAGWSSGGHLALMLGLTDASDGLEGDGANPGYSSRVQALVSAGGPTELASCYKALEWPVGTFLGASPEEEPAKYKAASPVTYATRDDPPILLIHGDSDREVPFSQAVLLDAKLKEVGVNHSLIVQEGEGHVDYLIIPEVLKFFDRHLKGL
jgi:acetyl esterase/lipase